MVTHVNPQLSDLTTAAAQQTQIITYYLTFYREGIEETGWIHLVEDTRISTHEFGM